MVCISSQKVEFSQNVGFFLTKPDKKICEHHRFELYFAEEGEMCVSDRVLQFSMSSCNLFSSVQTVLKRAGINIYEIRMLTLIYKNCYCKP